VSRLRSLFRRQVGGRVGLGIVVFVVLFSFGGPLVYRTDQVHTSIETTTQVPSRDHLLGTDEVGYDVLGRLMLGGQTSLEVGIAAAIIATSFGVLWGAIAGFFGGLLDAVMMRLVDALVAIPALFLLIVLGTIVTPSVPVLVLVIGGIAWLVPARLIRAETLSLRTREFVDAVRVMGGSEARIVLRHILPNVSASLMVVATFGIAGAILTEAGLSFLGLGVPVAIPSWGGMLAEGRQYVDTRYWLALFPGAALFVTVMAINLVGDTLRDMLDPYLHVRRNLDQL